MLRRLEGTAPPWYRVLPFIVICALLAVLVVVPVRMSENREELRSRIGEVVSPARAALATAEAAFAEEVAATRGYLATGDTAWLSHVRVAHQRQASAMVPLRRLTRDLGPEVRARQAVLEARREAWLVGPEDMLSGRRTRAALLAGLPRADAQFQEMLTASRELNRELLKVDRRLRAEIRANDARQFRIVALLSLAALAVAVVVGWLSFRLSRLSRALADETRKEAEARAEAEDAVRARDQVLRVVSHDLK
ncbi:MAG TPA: hypothetical protein VFQ39_09935, partial [Longimicrobium sp.]|nr:hypothetical protein [Longimicrobium sp.]